MLQRWCSTKPGTRSTTPGEAKALPSMRGCEKYENGTLHPRAGLGAKVMLQSTPEELRLQSVLAVEHILCGSANSQGNFHLTAESVSSQVAKNMPHTTSENKYIVNVCNMLLK